MQLNQRVHLVGSGGSGLRFTHRLDCNVYLLDGGSELALIDAGGGMEPERIVAQIENSGFDLRNLSTLLLTHAHGDHAAGARFWHNNFGTEVLCSAQAKPWLENADREKISLTAAIAAGIYPEDYPFPPCPIARGLNENDEIRIGEVVLRILETPGHARGHLSFLLEESGNRALFCGDLIFAGGKISLLNTWDCSIPEYSASVRKLHELNLDGIFPGHGAPLLSGAQRDIERAHSRFQKLGVPSTLF